MIRRLYVDNFRTLVNFEQKFGGFVLLLGPNGAGKSTVFDVLYSLVRCIVSQILVDKVFSREHLTHWIIPVKQTQTVELDVEGNGGLYRYRLVIEHMVERNATRVLEETITFDGHDLFRFVKGQASLFRDDFSPGPQFPMDWNRSGLAMVVAGADNRCLFWFRHWMERLMVVRLIPMAMKGLAEEEESFPDRTFGNFANWFLYLTLNKPRQMRLLHEKIRKILPGFDLFAFEPYGDARFLKVEFDYGDRNIQSLKFRQLSDGQRALIGLYTVLSSVDEEPVTLCLDEPDNFVSLQEIQPLLSELRDLTEKGRCQVLLISHHPRLINLMAGYGWWLDREEQGMGYTRSREIAHDGKGLSLATLIETDLWWD